MDRALIGEWTAAIDRGEIEADAARVRRVAARLLAGGPVTVSQRKQRPSFVVADAAAPIRSIADEFEAVAYQQIFLLIPFA
jgi:hypothetical protein